MKISIAMATFNGETYLREQLDSLAAQTLLPDELVISDDGSTDSTVNVAAAFAHHAPFPVRITRNNRNLGFTRNFENAILQCRGELIFLCDQDDVWFPEKIATVVDAFADKAEIMVVTSNQIITNSNLSHQGVTMADNLRRIGARQDANVLGCCTALRAKWAQALFPMPGATTVNGRRKLPTFDGWINEISTYLGRRRIIDRPLQYYRRHGANVSNAALHEPISIGLTTLISNRKRRAPIDEWQARIEVLEQYRMWIEQQSPAIAEKGFGTTAVALRQIDHEKNSIEARISIYDHPLPARFASVCALFVRGGYRYFHGLKSALYDLVRAS